MATVRLMLYDRHDRLIATENVTSATLLDAVTTAAVRGMALGVDFHVVEPPGAPLRMYWAGRRSQVVTREEARALLAEKGI